MSLFERKFSKKKESKFYLLKENNVLESGNNWRENSIFCGTKEQNHIHVFILK